MSNPLKFQMFNRANYKKTNDSKFSTPFKVFGKKVEMKKKSYYVVLITKIIILMSISMTPCLSVNIKTKAG